MNRERVVLTISGSDTDGPQMVKGLEVIANAFEVGKLSSLVLPERTDEIVAQLKSIGTGHYTVSVHRNTETLMDLLYLIANIAENDSKTDFVLVMAAGWLAALSGCAAGYLYYGLEAKNVFVVGVALEAEPDKEVPFEMRMEINPGTLPLNIFHALTTKQRRDLAAILAQTEVPGNLMITGSKEGLFFGEEGFLRACRFAVDGEISEDLRRRIAAAKAKEPKSRTFRDAIMAFGVTQTTV